MNSITFSTEYLGAKPSLGGKAASSLDAMMTLPQTGLEALATGAGGESEQAQTPTFARSSSVKRPCGRVKFDLDGSCLLFARSVLAEELRPVTPSSLLILVHFTGAGKPVP